MSTNPYAAPQADVRDVAPAQEFQEIHLLSPRGRIGRLRYLAYTFGFQLLVGVVAGILGAMMPEAASILLVPAYLVVLVFVVIIAIKRSHDMDWSGWTVLLMLIPLVGFIWIFKAGTAGNNRFGAPPPPNTTGVKVAALIVPLLFVLGVVAAIAIPAYQDYVQRQGLQ